MSLPITFLLKKHTALESCFQQLRDPLLGVEPIMVHLLDFVKELVNSF